LREYVSLKPIQDTKQKVSFKVHQTIAALMADVIQREIEFYKGEYYKMVLNLTRREEFDLRSAFNSLLRKNF